MVKSSFKPAQKQSTKSAGGLKGAVTKYVFVAICIFVLFGCGSNPSAPDAASKARNIILFIGDGMGEQHRLAAKLSSVGDSGLLAMDDMKVLGYARTKSAGDSVTDSAAAGTSISAGVKTMNKVIGLNKQLRFVPTILEEAKRKGKTGGLVTTTHITHATPAAFAAHVEDRNLMTVIAAQMLDADVDVLLGGGEDEFFPSTENGCFPEPGERYDGRNLVNEAVAAGYKYVCDYCSFSAVDPALTSKLLGLFADEGMTRPFSPSLAEMTKLAIDILSKSPNGFFLMVESGQIDWASHDNDISNAISDTLALDKAVEVAKSFAALNNDTLVIVTADHETGGLEVAISPKQAPKGAQAIKTSNGRQFYASWSSTNHTAINVPVTAMGPSAEMLKGVYENTHIYDVMLKAFN